MFDVLDTYLPPGNLAQKRLEAVDDRLYHLLLGLHLLDLLVYPLFDEDPFEGAEVEFFAQMAPLYLQLCSQHFDELSGMVGDDLAYRHDRRHVVPYDEGIDGNRVLAVGKGVERIDNILGVLTPCELYLDLHLVRREVVDGGYLQLVLLRRRLDGGDEALGGRTEGELTDDDPLGIGCVQPRPHENLADAVLVIGDVDKAAGKEVGVELYLLASQGLLDRLEHFAEVVREYAGGHADGDSLGPLDEYYGDLCGKYHRFSVATVVAVVVPGDLGAVEHLLGEGLYPRLDVPGGGGLVAGQQAAEVALLLDEELLVRQHHQRRVDGGVAVGVVLHAVTDDVGHLVELAVVYLEEAVEDSTLYRFETVLHIGYGAVLDDV